MKLKKDEMAEEVVKKLTESKEPQEITIGNRTIKKKNDIIDLTEFIIPDKPLKNVLINKENICFFMIEEETNIAVPQKKIATPGFMQN